MRLWNSCGALSCALSVSLSLPAWATPPLPRAARVAGPPDGPSGGATDPAASTDAPIRRPEASTGGVDAPARPGGDVSSADGVPARPASEGGPADDPPVEGPQAPAPASAVDEYKQRRIRFAHPMAGEAVHMDTTYKKNAPVYVGQDVVSVPQMYREMGRTDLADKYRQKNGARIGVAVAMVSVGLGLIGGGLYFQLRDTEASFGEPGLNADERVAIGMFLPGVLLGAGGAIFGSLLDPNPLPKADTSKMVTEHNARLRAELGVPSKEGASGGDGH